MTMHFSSWDGLSPEQSEQMQGLFREVDAFVFWLFEQTEMAVQATQALNSLPFASPVAGMDRVSLVQARDGAQVLAMCAREGHFDQVADLFTGVYEHYCRALLGSV
jgi:hypothetical protein